MICTPGCQSRQSGAQGFAIFAEPVLGLQDFAGVNGSGEDAFFLQLTQLLDKHFVAHAGDRAAQFAKALRAVFELSQDEWFPLAADDVDGRFDGAIFDAHGR